jgi:flagellar basal-body rod protein FlgB
MSLIDYVGRFLDIASYRNTVVSTNMANVDTPGYRTRDVDFRAELLRAASGDQGAMMPAARELQGLPERPDGNNVSMDRESLVLAENQMQFRLGVDVLKTEFRRLLSAINEGK